MAPPSGFTRRYSPSPADCFVRRIRAHRRRATTESTWHRATILVFLDDDFVPDPNLLAEHLTIHDSDNRVAVIGPTPSISRYREPWIAWQQTTMARTCAAMALGEREPGFREFWSGNCSVARQHVIAVGGFDASLRSYEDVELGYRLMRHGLRFRFCPSATGLHYSAHSFAKWCATIRDYAPFSIRLFRQLGDDTMYDLLILRLGG